MDILQSNKMQLVKPIRNLFLYCQDLSSTNRNLLKSSYIVLHCVISNYTIPTCCVVSFSLIPTYHKFIQITPLYVIAIHPNA